MRYKARISSPFTNFFDEENCFLFSVRKKRQYYFLGINDTAKIVDINDKTLIEFEYKSSIFSDKIKVLKIIEQNFSSNIYFGEEKNNLILTVDNQKLSLNRKIKLFGFYEGIIKINDEKFANIKETGKLFNPITIYNFEFFSNSTLNFYCLILFAVYSIEIFNGD